MPYSHFNLEEQLRMDRRVENARKRKRKLRRLFPLLLILLLVLSVLFYYFSKKESSEPEATTAAPAPGSTTATLSFVGDICLDEAMMESFRTQNGYDFTDLFQRILPRLAPADLTVGNFEGNISGNSEAADYCYPPALLQALYAVGFDVLQTANSYTIQNGITGLAATKQAIQAAGMDALGTWVSEEDRSKNGVLIRDVNGIRIAFLAFTKGMNNLRLPVGAEYSVNLLYSDYDTNYSKIARSAIEQAVTEARLQNPDLIIAMVHWGSEFDRQVTDSQEEIAELLFQKGVNLIIGAHSHYVGPIDLKNKRITPEGGNLVAYSLGDFVSVADSFSARNGCILTVQLRKDGDGIRITDLRYTPTFSAAPSEDLKIEDYAVLDTLGAISFYKEGYYDRVSDELYEELVSALADMKEQTGLPDNMAE